MPERSDLGIMKTKNTAEKSGRGVKEILSGTLVRVLCVIAAFCLWLYVEEARSTTVEAQFDLIKIETRYEENLEANSAPPSIIELRRGVISQDESAVFSPLPKSDTTRERVSV